MARTLWEALGEVPDRRGRKGRQYPLQGVLGIAIAAMLAGANDLIAIFRWGRRLKPEALRLFGIETGKAPCHATYHYFFQALDADALSRTLGAFALEQGEARAPGDGWQNAEGQPAARPQRPCMCFRPLRRSLGP